MRIIKELDTIGLQLIDDDELGILLGDNEARFHDDVVERCDYEDYVSEDSSERKRLWMTFSNAV